MQRQFNQALFSSTPEARDSLLQDIRGDNMRECNQRLNVYRNNVFVSLMDALGEVFPVCKQVVGEAFFNAMARQYIERHPPTSPILSGYGDQFSEFVQNFFPAQSLLYLPCLCDVEYRLLQLTHAAEVPTLSLEAAQQRLSQVQNPEALRLHLDPQCELLSVPFAVGSLYLAHQSETPNLNQLDIAQNEYLLLAKAGLYGRMYLISAAEFDFLSALQSDPSLSQALPDQADFELGQTLARLMTWQVFHDIQES
ncbi:hypothetical protein MAQ5080_01439 [Marinomonas aquimarina]|uniref:Putative DNA-binding domain-containing protein n=1 Tax=Marinomonas aquimarina TaxID=295068 RepID=A0A1A8TBQ9_9GAMM|nr:DNA-binding domain-containing protein [Marinomonas aquimarina]SBS29600.1 hypothetical protein MAQ5080_01439 [Marinomonas aquimarina]